jgi:hypothetical protein
MDLFGSPIVIGTPKFRTFSLIPVRNSVILKTYCTIWRALGNITGARE